MAPCFAATLGAFSLGTVICWPAVAQPFLDETGQFLPYSREMETGEVLPLGILSQSKYSLRNTKEKWVVGNLCISLPYTQ